LRIAVPETGMTFLRLLNTRNADILVLHETNMTLPLDMLGELYLPMWSETMALQPQITCISVAARDRLNEWSQDNKICTPLPQCLY